MERSTQTLPGGLPPTLMAQAAIGPAAVIPAASLFLLVSGQNYTITGDFKPDYAGFNTGSPGSFGVTIDAVLGYEGENSDLATWKSFSFNFVATGTSETLALSAERKDSDNDYGVDNISIAPAAVPEASSVVSLGLLLLLGAGGAVSRKRKVGEAG